MCPIDASSVEFQTRFRAFHSRTSTRQEVLYQIIVRKPFQRRFKNKQADICRSVPQIRCDICTWECVCDVCCPHAAILPTEFDLPLAQRSMFCFVSLTLSHLFLSSNLCQAWPRVICCTAGAVQRVNLINNLNLPAWQSPEILCSVMPKELDDVIGVGVFTVIFESARNPRRPTVIML